MPFTEYIHGQRPRCIIASDTTPTSKATTATAASGETRESTTGSRTRAIQKKYQMSETEKKAIAFRKAFVPKVDVDYGWVLARAKEQYKLIDDTLIQLDAKASAIVTHFGSGTAVATFAAIAGIATSSVSASVAVWATPAFVLASISIALAALCRKPMTNVIPPSVEDCIYFLDNSVDLKSGEAFTLGSWHEANVVNTETTRKKASLLEWSTYAKCASIILLILPLFVAVMEKNKVVPTVEPKPLEVKLLQP